MEMIQNLKELTSSVLEKMFFLNQETEPINKNFNFKYAVNIKDPRVDIVILFCEKTARLMTENFLGTDDITETDIHDTIKESLNIIAGNYISTALSEYTKKIHIPVLFENISKLTFDQYESALLFYKEEPLKILLKIE